MTQVRFVELWFLNQHLSHQLKYVESNIEIKTANSELVREQVIAEVASDLTDTEIEKFASLVEDVEFDNKETFEQKVSTIKDSYFKGEVTESVDEVNSMAGEDTAEVVEVSEAMSRYTQAITKFNK